MIRILFASLLLTPPAHASPERSITVSDLLVAQTQTHFYVLRDVSDNHGSYFISRGDQYLVEISLTDGKASEHWLLRSMRLQDTMAEYTFDDVHDYPAKTHDMMQILAARNAVPVYMDHLRTHDLRLHEPGYVELIDAVIGTQVPILIYDNASLIMEQPDINAMAFFQMAPLAARYGNLSEAAEERDILHYPALTYQDISQGDPFCVVQARGAARVGYGETANWLIPIRCEIEVYPYAFLDFHLILSAEIWE